VDVLVVSREFVPFGPSHGVVVAVLIVVAVGLVAIGRAQRGTPAEQRTSRVFAAVFAIFLVPLQVFWMLPSQWGVGYSLPLQLCDLAAVAAVWALWSHSKTASALTYFWGLTLTAQAFVTPELNGPDFPSLQFIMFFGMHCLVVWAGIYLTFGVGLHPDWRTYRITVFATIVWGVVMFAFNLAAGTNYGFLNAKPRAGSLLDLLGPWPWYLLSEMIVGAAAWALITWPWVRQRGRRRAPTADVTSGASSPLTRPHDTRL
jgi:hypothetical integral membrane protein (TIGR02206 family)